MRFWIRVLWIYTCFVGGWWLLSWLFEDEPSTPFDEAFSFAGATILVFIVAVGQTLQDMIIGLGGNLDILKNEIDSPYGGLKSKMDNLEKKMDDLKNEIDSPYGGLKDKMDEIQRDLRRNEKSGRTKEESEEED